MLLKRKMLSHSAKGSEWEEHKYIKRIDGTYYYPDSYEGGRHLSDFSENEKENNNEPIEIDNLTVDDIEKLANEVIRGNFGNGSIRKELLGENYRKIQDRVNELMETIGSRKVETASSSESTTETKDKSTKKETKSTGVSGVDMSKVLDVYKKKK